MWQEKNRVQNMTKTINIDRFTRLKQSINGKLDPQKLPRLAEYLAGEGGEINYSMAGNLALDPSGSQQRRVKCIIYGWFLLADPVTLASVRYALDVNSTLILVTDESALPPLEMESASEDYVICGAEMNIVERVEEEILLNLPAQAVNSREMIASHDGRKDGGAAGALKFANAPKTAAADGAKLSPFARLAALKKK